MNNTDFKIEFKKLPIVRIIIELAILIYWYFIQSQYLIGNNKVIVILSLISIICLTNMHLFYNKHSISKTITIVRPVISILILDIFLVVIDLYGKFSHIKVRSNTGRFFGGDRRKCENRFLL